MRNVWKQARQLSPVVLDPRCCNLEDGAMEKQVAMLKESSFFGEDLPEPQKARRQTQLRSSMLSSFYFGNL